MLIMVLIFGNDIFIKDFDGKWDLINQTDSFKDFGKSSLTYFFH